MENKIQTLISQNAIEQRIGDLAAEISAHYGNEEILVLTVLNGAMIFTADLIRRITTPLHLDSIAVASYENNASTGKLTFRSQLKLPVANRKILLIDDILDTGNTAQRLIAYLYEQGAGEVKFCVLLDKQLEQSRQISAADFTGFKIPNHYVVGYGLDADEKYRNLPFIGII
ncbi:MAG: hypoxanthine phosphoribosyltransferase [Victivallaceae bacterium]